MLFLLLAAAAAAAPQARAPLPARPSSVLPLKTEAAAVVEPPTARAQAQAVSPETVALVYDGGAATAVVEASAGLSVAAPAALSPAAPSSVIVVKVVPGMSLGHYTPKSQALGYSLMAGAVLTFFGTAAGVLPFNTTLAALGGLAAFWTGSALSDGASRANQNQPLLAANAAIVRKLAEARSTAFDPGQLVDPNWLNRLRALQGFEGSALVQDEQMVRILANAAAAETMESNVVAAVKALGSAGTASAVAALDELKGLLAPSYHPMIAIMRDSAQAAAAQATRTVIAVAEIAAERGLKEKAAAASARARDAAAALMNGGWADRQRAQAILETKGRLDAAANDADAALALAELDRLLTR